MPFSDSQIKINIVNESNKTFDSKSNENNINEELNKVSNQSTSCIPESFLNGSNANESNNIYYGSNECEEDYKKITLKRLGNSFEQNDAPNLIENDSMPIPLVISESRLKDSTTNDSEKNNLFLKPNLNETNTILESNNLRMTSNQDQISVRLNVSSNAKKGKKTIENKKVKPLQNNLNLNKKEKANSKLKKKEKTKTNQENLDNKQSADPLAEIENKKRKKKRSKSVDSTHRLLNQVSNLNLLNLRSSKSLLNIATDSQSLQTLNQISQSGSYTRMAESVLSEKMDKALSGSDNKLEKRSSLSSFGNFLNLSNPNLLSSVKESLSQLSLNKSVSRLSVINRNDARKINKKTKKGKKNIVLTKNYKLKPEQKRSSKKLGNSSIKISIVGSKGEINENQLSRANSKIGVESGLHAREFSSQTSLNGVKLTETESPKPLSECGTSD